MTRPYRRELAAAGAKYLLDLSLVDAVVEQESGGNSWAWNPEPRYRWLWNVRTGAPFRAVSVAEVSAKFPPTDFPALAGDRDQEWWGQQASWGLMQIMGAVAREHRFAGHYLTELTEPAMNLELGCRHLARLIARMRNRYTGPTVGAEHTILRAALASYNGGPAGNEPDHVPDRNRKYADEVLERFHRIKRARAQESHP